MRDPNHPRKYFPILYHDEQNRVHALHGLQEELKKIFLHIFLPEDDLTSHI
jgi:hypothetical protein